MGVLRFRIGYNIKVLQQTACLVVSPITFGNFVLPFNCMPAGRTSDSMTVSSKNLFIEMVTCWERADLLILLCAMFSCVLSLFHTVS